MNFQASICKEQRTTVETLKKNLKSEKSETSRLILELHELNAKFEDKQQECSKLESNNRSLANLVRKLTEQNRILRQGRSFEP